MISELTIKNFKCLAKATMTLEPLTLLAGLNAAGKSSVIQSLLTLRQSYLMGSLSRGHLSTSGDLVDLGGPGEVLFEWADADCIEISFRRDEDRNTLIQFPFMITEDRASAIMQDDDASRRAIDLMLKGGASAVLLQGEVHGEPPRSAFHYLHAERHGPRKFLPMSASRARAFDLGTRGEYVLHALHEYQGAITLSENDPRVISDLGGRLGDQVEGWLGEVSPGAQLDMTPVTAADLIVGAFTFAQEGELRSREYRATNVGFGLSYVLPVLVALLGAPAGGLVLIENPEAHLHPRGQTRLGELCARAAAAGVQVIVETHSDHFMDGARIAVREGILAPQQAAFHYFKRVNGRSEILSPSIDREGKLSAWPEGFFDQHRRNTARLVKPKIS
ncbi:DUF3696 domain-containing protein [Microvirga sp. 2TAF3]|uniref:DUF3696 domain-containing protein n=1 Tax=Microvirga sp. 2TAF3 TaxID=3233014 RepID=UPI003F9A861A